MCKTLRVFIPAHSVCLLAGHKVESLWQAWWICSVLIDVIIQSDAMHMKSWQEHSTLNLNLQTCPLFNSPQRGWRKNVCFYFFAEGL